jgi:hypothetical protein
LKPQAFGSVWLGKLREVSFMPISIGGISSAAIRKVFKPFQELHELPQKPDSGMDLSTKVFDSFVKSEPETEKKLRELPKEKTSKVKKVNSYSTSNLQSFKSSWKDSIKASQEILRDNLEFLRSHLRNNYLENLLDNELLIEMHNTVKEAFKNLQTKSVDYLVAKTEYQGSIYSPTQRLSQALAAGDIEAAERLAKTLSSDEIKNAFSQECKKGNVTGVKALLAIKPELTNEADFIWIHFLEDGVSAGKSKMMHALFKHLPAHRQTEQSLKEAEGKINPNFSAFKKKRITKTLTKLSQNFPKSGDSV